MNSRKYLLLFSIVVLTLVSSCEKEAAEPEKTKVLFPLSTGNSWTYRFTMLSSSGTTIDTMKMSIGEKVTIRGNVGYIVKNGEAPQNAAFFGINDDKGNFKLIGGFSAVDTLIAPSIQLKINAFAGEVWDYNDITSLYSEGTFQQEISWLKCITADTLITTPAGTFNCKLFEQKRNSGDDTFRNFYAENIGMIRAEHYEYKKLFSFSELIAYELK